MLVFSFSVRWNNAVKVAQSSGSNSKQDALAKAHALQSEYEDNTLLFHQLQDSLATEMFTFVAGERSYAESVIRVRIIFRIGSFLFLKTSLKSGGNSPFPSLHCCYKINTTTTMQRESS